MEMYHQEVITNREKLNKEEKTNEKNEIIFSYVFNGIVLY